MHFGVETTLLTRASLFLGALLGLLPYVSTVKLPPIPSFWPEWISAVLWCCWLISLRKSTELKPSPDGGSAIASTASAPALFAVPVVVFAFLAFGVALLVQLLARMPMFRGAPLLSLGMLALAILVCVAGNRLQVVGEASRMLDIWARALLVALVINVVATLAARHGLHLYIYRLGLRGPPGRAEGLLGQPNQLAVFSVLASTAGHYLWMRGKLPSVGCVLVALCSALLIAGSASRAGALLWAMSVALSALALRRHPRRTTGWRLLVVAAVLFLVAQATWTSLDPGASAASVKTLRADSRGRLELLRDSWELIRLHPLTGVGYGNFMAARWNELSNPLFEPAANHAHNLVAELGAELGVIAASLVLLPLGFAIWRCLAIATRRGVKPEQFFAACIVLILAGYSLVEFPLWYVFFLLPFALALGIADPRPWRVSVCTVPPSARWVGRGVAGLLCAVLAFDYQRSEEIYSSMELQQREGNGAPVLIPFKATSDIAALSAFDLYANLMYSRALVPDGLFMKYKLGISERAMNSMTNQETIARQIALLVVADDEAAAHALLVRTRRSPDLEGYTRDVLALLAPLHPKLAAFVKALPPMPSRAPTQAPPSGVHPE